MEKPRPALQHRPPFPLYGDRHPEPVKQMHADMMLKSIRETHEALVKWNEYFAEFRETTVNDTDGDVYILLAKDVREEPQGKCPFLLRAKRSTGDTWIATEAPGVVIFEDDDGTLTPIIPTYEGTEITEFPEFEITPDQSTWHVHQRDGSGKLTAVHVLIGEEEPELREGETALKMATLKKEDTRYWIDTEVGGVYVLKRGGGSSSSSSSSSSSGSDAPPSDSGSDSSKSAIVPFDGEWIGWFAVEKPQAMFEDVATVKLDENGEGLKIIHQIMAGCTEPGSIIATSAMPDVPSMVAAQVMHLGGMAFIYAAAKSLPGMARATNISVNIEGVMKGSPERWKRYTEKQARSNAEFYALAHDPKRLAKLLK